MSDANPQHHDDGPHEGPVRTTKQLIQAVLFAFVVPVVVIVLLVMAVTSKPLPAAGTQALTPVAIAQRIQPVGMVQVKDASDLTTLKSGEQVYAAQCAACHTPGLVGSPKFGDVAAWAPRIKTGYEALVKSAIGGKGNMGPQGGGDFSDLEIGRAVVYLANQGGAKFEEPALPATAGASAPAGGTAAAMPAPGAAPAAGPAPAPAPAPAATSGSAAAPAAPAATMAAAPAATGTAPAATTVAAAPAAAGAVPALYTQICQACHVAGVAGAPKLGDKAAWATRLADAKGIDGLVASVIKGKGAMPPKGGSNAPDVDIKAVVTYMVNASK